MDYFPCLCFLQRFVHFDSLKVAVAKHDWFWHVNSSRVTLCVKVMKLHTLYIYIYILVLFLKIFFCTQFYDINIPTNTNNLISSIVLTIELTVRQWPGRLGFNPRSSHTNDSNMVLDAALLNTQHYKVGIKGKVEQSREWCSAPLTP